MGLLQLSSDSLDNISIVLQPLQYANEKKALSFVLLLDRNNFSLKVC